MRSRLIITVGLIILFCGGIVGVFAKGRPSGQKPIHVRQVKEAISGTILSADVSRRLRSSYQRLRQENERIQVGLAKFLEEKREARIWQQRALQSLSLSDRVGSFLLGVRQLQAEGKTRDEIHRLLQQRLSLQKTNQSGSISGTVKVQGSIPPGEVTVYAFDVYGYLVGEAVTSLFNGSYSIGNLPAGDYYVFTESDFVDELYNNVFLRDFEQWRQATLVHVAENASVSNIDFDLERGATVKGVLTDAATSNPLAFNVVFIKVYSVSDPGEVLQTETLFTSMTGEYSFTIGDLGAFKIYAEVPSYTGEFYNNKPDWAGADPVIVSDPNQTITGIDFALEYSTGPPVVSEGSVISGSITSQVDGTPLTFVLVFAFDTADTSVAGFSLSGLFFGKAAGQAQIPNYAITGLDSGSYVVLATDLLQGYSREFYQESSTPEGATPVTVAENDTATGIDFTLDMGGAISGTVKNENGDPLQNVLVIALKGGLDFDKFFSNVDIGFDTTNASGEYRITGISSGDYRLRSLAITNDALGGQYLDEWYEDVHNIFGYENATLVTVNEPNETPGIDFVLERAGIISGKILAAADGTPVNDVEAVFPLDATSQMPVLAPFEYTGDGTYTLSMLETGSYILYAFVDPASEGMFISEFYDGAARMEDATPVDVVQGSTTGDIDFTLEKGGVIQGFVYLDPEFSAGADTLMDFPVVAFNSVTGQFGGAANVTFSGGYRISGIPAGNYKVVAYPLLAPHATTYYGGGSTFDDPQSAVVTVTPGSVQDVEIDLDKAQGSITGSVSDGETGDPIDFALVFAYDATGHIVSAGMTGMDIVTQYPTGNPGVYAISNLRSGSYFVRSFAQFILLQGVFKIVGGEGTLEDPFSLFGGIGDLFTGGVFKDEWYDDIPIAVPTLDFNSILGFLSSVRFEEFGLMPFFQLLPAGITAVDVVDGQTTSGIDFVLGSLSMEDFVTVSVPETRGEGLPHSFELGQSYPNPVHRNRLSRGVTIQVQLPEASTIAIAVYNILGQKVVTILDRKLSAGYHSVRWTGKDERGNLVPSGVYFYALSGMGGRKQMKKLVILR